jgi:hypothetical protein
LRANYVRNIARDPRGRVRIGWRYRWVTGVAAALRAMNAINVRVLGADLLTVHVRLMPDGSTGPTEASAQQERQLLIDDSWSGRIKPSLSGVRLLYASECPASSLRSSG